MSAPRIVTLDIERQSAIVDGVWQLKQHGYIQPRQIIVPSRMICLSWKWLGDNEVHFSAEWDPEDDGVHIHPKPYKNTGLLEDYHDGHKLMTEIARNVLHEADYVIGWNSKQFDIKHIQEHIAEHGVSNPSPWHDIDLIKTSRSQFGFLSHKLDEALAHFGLGSKLETTGDLWRILRWGSGQKLVQARKLMRDYNCNDVIKTEAIFDKMLPWIKGLNLYGSPIEQEAEIDGDIRCRRCGSKDLAWNAAGPRRFTTYWYRRFQCRSCYGWGHGTKSFYHMETASS